MELGGERVVSDHCFAVSSGPVFSVFSKGRGLPDLGHRGRIFFDIPHVPAIGSGSHQDNVPASFVI